MKFNTAKNSILLCREARVTPFLWGHRGIGKSSLIREICDERGWGFVDLRCSQLEASDIRGLPDRRDDRTVYLPPADMPVADLSITEVNKMINAKEEKVRYKEAALLQPRLEKGILFLDEINRAQDDVLQAVFQLVLDRKVGQFVLPPGWSVVCAGNFMEGYQVNGFNDPAFLNRFCHLTLSDGEATMEEWVDYMAMVHGEDASTVIEFATQNLKHLDGEVKGNLGFSVQPSRRSWDAVVRVENSAKVIKSPQDAITEVVAGLVGRDPALAYQRYSCPVKPKDVIDKGVKAMASKLKGLERNQMMGLTWGLVSFLKGKVDADEKLCEVATDFAFYICTEHKQKDLVVAFAKALVSTGNTDTDNIRVAAISNPRVAQLLAKAQKRGSKDKSTKTFLESLCARPELQAVLSKVSWGLD